MKKLLVGLLLMTNLLLGQYTVIVQLTAKEGCNQRLLQILKDAKKFVENDDSCLAYRIHQDLNSERSFTLYETWQTKDAHQDHHKTEYISSLAQELKDIIEPGKVFQELAEIDA